MIFRTLPRSRWARLKARFSFINACFSNAFLTIIFSSSTSKRLLNKIVRAEFEGFARRIDRRKARHQNDADVRQKFTRRAQQLDAVHIGIFTSVITTSQVRLAAFPEPRARSSRADIVSFVFKTRLKSCRNFVRRQR
jgi:hypothetical protein